MRNRERGNEQVRGADRGDEALLAWAVDGRDVRGGGTVPAEHVSPGTAYLRIMSFDRGFRIDLTPDQVVELAKQLPSKEKRALAEAFEREGLITRLSEIMTSLKDVDIDEETIRKEVDVVRAKRYAAWKRKAAKSSR